MGCRKYDPICSFGKKGVSYYLNKDVSERKYYLFKTSGFGAKKEGRINVPAETAKLISSMPKKDGCRFCSELFSSSESRKIYRGGGDK